MTKDLKTCVALAVAAAVKSIRRQKINCHPFPAEVGSLDIIEEREIFGQNFSWNLGYEAKNFVTEIHS